MKIDQIAYYSHNDKQTEELKRMLGLENEPWIADTVTGNVSVYDSREKKVVEGVSTANLLFNYTRGIEIEILTYTSGPHWHMRKGLFILKLPFLSHIAAHMEEGEKAPHSEEHLVQTMDTTSHTNEKIRDSRRYHYEIYSTTPLEVAGPGRLPAVFTDFKYIWRKNLANS